MWRKVVRCLICGRKLWNNRPFEVVFFHKREILTETKAKGPKKHQIERLKAKSPTFILTGLTFILYSCKYSSSQRFQPNLFIVNLLEIYFRAHIRYPLKSISLRSLQIVKISPTPPPATSVFWLLRLTIKFEI